MAESPRTFYVICGAEAYLRQQALADVLRRRRGADDDLALTRFDGSLTGLSLADVLDEVRTVALLGGERTVVVSDADAFINRHRDGLQRFCESAPSTGCLILDCDGFDKRFKLYAAVKKHGQIIECPPLRGAEVAAWITRHAQTVYGKTIARGAAERLRELCGDSLGMLDTEVAKLGTYAGERREITVADVELLVGANREQMVFAVTDAMADGDTATALRQWRRVVETDRAAVGRAIAGMASAVRGVLQVRRALDRGESPPAGAKSPWAQQKAMAQAARYTTTALEDQLSDLMSADVAAKTGLADFDSAIEQFIVRHTTYRRPPGLRTG